MTLGTWSTLFAAVLLGACSESPRPLGFDSALPAARVVAINSEEHSGPQRLARLIEQLDHDDALVRLTSIHKLEGLTGLTHDYRYDAPLHDRKTAVERWVEWLNTTATTGDDHSP